MCVEVLLVALSGCKLRAAGTAVQFRRSLFAENGSLDVAFVRVSCCCSVLEFVVLEGREHSACV